MITIRTTLEGEVTVTSDLLEVFGNRPGTAPIVVVTAEYADRDLTLSLVEAESLALALQAAVHAAMNPEETP